MPKHLPDESSNDKQDDRWILRVRGTTGDMRRASFSWALLLSWHTGSITRIIHLNLPLQQAPFAFRLAIATSPLVTLTSVGRTRQVFLTPCCTLCFWTVSTNQFISLIILLLTIPSASPTVARSIRTRRIQTQQSTLHRTLPSGLISTLRISLMA